MEIDQEDFRVERIDEQQFRIVHSMFTPDGVDMGSEMVIQKANLVGLQEMLGRFIGGVYGKQEFPMEPDHFNVFEGGTDWQRFFHLHNYRKNGDLPATYVITFSLEMVPDLIDKLKAFSDEN